VSRSARPPIVVVGAGAAGLVAAIFAARSGRRVVLLERTSDGGRKILISGGGRCNVLPAQLDEQRFVTDSSPHSLRKMLRSWPLEQQRDFFARELHIPLALEAESGKLFPASNRARDVRDGLVGAALAAGVVPRFGACLADLMRNDDGTWSLTLDGSEPLEAAAVVLATGGLSVPQTGSDGIGLRLAARLGHRVQPTYAALTPLTLTPNRYAALSGVSLPVTLTGVTSGRPLSARGGFLFTHRGFSGPVVLDLSHLAVRALAAGRHADIRVSWTNQTSSECDEYLRQARGSVAAAMRPLLPQRLAEMLAGEAGVAMESRLAELPRAQRRALVEALSGWSLPYNGHEGYRKAEVTGGGVALDEVDARTLESRRHRGLHFCGEVLDAFGPIGGYNFAWAWATGRAAGLGAAQQAA